MRTISLTPNEADILLHRLTASDCIADALLDGDLFDTGTTVDDIMECAARLEKQIETTKTVSVNDRLDQFVLEDAADGSTFFGSSEGAVDSGELTHQKLTAQLKACDSLEVKLKSIGLDVQIPRC